MSATEQNEDTRSCFLCGYETCDQALTSCPHDGTPLAGIDPLIDTRVDKYHIMEVLGRGGMSSVYKARHLYMDKIVAIKLMRAELMYDAKLLQRFQLEAKAVSKLNHPNILAVTDFGVTQEAIPYMVMDFLQGKAVDEILDAEAQLHPERCIKMFIQVCDALGHAHRKNVIHRDIKPSNIMVLIDEDGLECLKIVDFGIAKMLHSENTSAPSLTGTGEIFGSPLYMAPEQYKGQPVDARTDIYALGCVIYECVTGVPALRGVNVMETMYKHLSEMPLPFDAVRSDLNLPKSLESAVFKAVSKDPDQRFQTMEEFKLGLIEALRDFGVNLSPQDVTFLSGAHSPINVSRQPYEDATTGTEGTLRVDQAMAQQKSHTPAEAKDETVENAPKSEGRTRRACSVEVTGSDLFGYTTLTPAAPETFGKDERGSSTVKGAAETSVAQAAERHAERHPVAQPVEHSEPVQRQTSEPPAPSASTIQSNQTEEETAAWFKNYKIIGAIVVLLGLLGFLAFAH